MEMGHIGVFLNGYPDPDGTTTAVRGLNRALARLGYKITIYCSGHEKPGPDENAPNYQVVHYQRRYDQPLHVPEQLCGRVASNQDGIDFLILHTMFSPANVRLARLARLAAIPYVMCPHDPYHPLLLKKNRVRKLVYHWIFERPLLAGAAAVQFLDGRHISHIAALGVETPAIVVPNGFDVADVKESRAAMRLPGDPSFLCLGRLDIHHKGLDLLIEGLSFARRNGDLPRTVVVNFVGPDAPAKKTLEKLAKRLRVEENIRFAGWFSNEDRWSALLGCDASILCSRYDGFGLSALETMLAGRPVILSTETGIYPWARQARCGFFVEPNVASVAAGLSRAVAGRGRWNNMGARGRAFAYAHLTWNHIALEAHEQYQKLMQRLNLRRPVINLPGRAAGAD
jgi:glycosyltransferase involved in cell wall biosynthesis